MLRKLWIVNMIKLRVEDMACIFSNLLLDVRNILEDKLINKFTRLAVIKTIYKTTETVIIM